MNFNKQVVMKRAVCVLLAIVLLGVYYLPGRLKTTRANEEKEVDVTLTDVTVVTEDGQNVSDLNSVPHDITFFVRYHFDIPDIACAGDKAYINLPEEVKVNNSSENNLIYIYVEGHENDPEYLILTAVYDQELHRLDITFADLVDEYDSLSAYIYFEGCFDSEAIGSGGDRTIIFGQDGDGNNIEIQVDFNKSEAKLEKTSSELGYDEERNAYLVQWSFVIDPNGGNMNHISLTDTFPEGFRYVEGSVEYDPLPADGWKLITENDNKAITLTNDGPVDQVTTIKIIAEIDDFTGLTGITEADGYTSYEVMNKVILNYQDDSGTYTLEDDDTLKLKPRVLFKGGEYSPETKNILWELTLNEDHTYLNKPKLTDKLPEGLSFETGSVMIYEMDSQGNFTEVSDINKVLAWEYEESTNTVVFSFKDAFTKCYRLTYTTAITEEDFFEKNNTKEFENYAYLSGCIGGAGGPVYIPVKAYSSLIEKYARGYDANTQEVSWELVINQNRNDLFDKKITIQDTLEAYHEYVENSMVVTGYNGSTNKTLEKGIDYQINYNKTTRELEIEFLTAIDNLKLTIQFRTKVTELNLLAQNAKNVQIENTAVLFIEGTEIDRDTAVEKINPEILAKKAVGIDYINKIITWRISINKYQLSLPGKSTFTDTLPAGLTLVEDSVYYTDSSGVPLSGALVNGADFSYDRTGRILEIQFTNLDETKYIQFQTQIDADYLENEFIKNQDVTFKNQANLEMEAVNKPVLVSESAKVKNTVVGKSGAYEAGNDYIDWTVLMNSNALDWDLSGATLTDKLQDGLQLDTNTVRLTKNELQSNGTYVEVEEYELTGEHISYQLDTGVFIFTFPEVEEGWVYILSFTTNVTKQGSYSNSIKMEGNITGNSETPPIGINLGSGGGGATGGIRKTGITIQKIDDTNGAPVAGARFALLDKFGNQLAVSGPTGTDGKIVFPHIAYGSEYSIVEIETPEGYLPDEEPILIHVVRDPDTKLRTVTVKGNAYLEGTEPDEHGVSVITAADDIQVMINKENILIKGDVKVRKTDADGNLLKGAAFVLKQGTEVRYTSISDEKGIAMFKDIPYGSYTLEEQSAPDGYNHTGESREVVIDKNKKLYTYEFENELYEFTFLKTDKKSTGLPGAVFHLLKQQEDGSYQKLKVTSEGQLQWDLADTEAAATDLVSGADGIVTIQGLSEGSYQLAEVKAPAGYMRNDQVYTFTIKRDTDGKLTAYDNHENPIGDARDDTAANLLVIRNYQGGFRLKKTDGINEHTIPEGTVFTLFTAEQFAGYQAGSIPAKGSYLKQYTVNSSGVIEDSQIAPGSYVLVETEATAEYQLNQYPFYLEIPDSYGSSYLADLGNFQNFKESGTLKKSVVTKQHGEEPLEGAVFELYEAGMEAGQYEEKLLGTAVSQADGTIDVVAAIAAVKQGPADGYYKMREVWAPVGYFFTEQWIYFSITGNQVFCDNMNVVNHQLEIKLMKKDRFGNPLTGGQFELVKYEEGAEIKLGAENTPLLVSADNTGSIYYRGLPGIGTYRIYERMAPDGYYINPNYIEFTITSLPEEPEIVALPDFINYKGSAQFKKIDEDGNSLAGIYFIIEDITDGLKESERDPVQTLLSDPAGNVLAEDLTPGHTYRFVETDANGDYIVNSNHAGLTFTMPDNQLLAAKQYGEDGKPLPLAIDGDQNGLSQFTNYRGAVKVCKVSRDGKQLPGAFMGLYKIGSNGNPETEPLQTAETDANGEVSFTGLVPGSYLVREEKAPSPEESSGAYLLNQSQDYYFTVAESADGKPAIIDETTEGEKGRFVNYNGKLTVKKQNERKEALAGAVFVVLDEAGQIAKDLNGNLMEQVTDETGMAVFDYVPAGTWVIQEKEAPAGYVRSEDSVTVTIPETHDSEYQVAITDAFMNYKGSIALKKTAEDGAFLKDAWFQVMDADGVPVGIIDDSGEEVFAFATDEYGNLEIDGLSPGSYTLQEITPPTGYVLNLNNEGLSFTIPESAEEKPILTLTDAYLNFKGECMLIKYGVDKDGKKAPSAGAVFQLYRLSDPLAEGAEIIPFTPEELYGKKIGPTQASNENGEVVFKNLKPGTYYPVEVTAAAGYVRNLNTAPFTIAAEYDQKQVLQVEALNYKGSVTLKKTDENGQILEGAAFDLYYISADGEESLINDADAPYITEAETGMIHLADLDAGDYYFQETHAPEGYLINPSRLHFTIPESAQDVPETVVLEDFMNYKGSIRLAKTDIDGEPIAGAVFTVYRTDVDPETEIAELTSGPDGNLYLDSLEKGTYRLEESAAGAGYLKNTEPLEFAIEDPEVSHDGPPTIDLGQFINYQGKVVLLKINEEKEPLNGAQFSLYQKTAPGHPDLLIADGLLTSEEGLIEYDRLPPGEYYFAETKAPEGYILNEETIPFTIADAAPGEPEAVTAVLGGYTNYRGAITLRKTDPEGTAITSGDAIFGIYTDAALTDPVLGIDGSPLKASSDESGVVRFSQLSPGHYYIAEEQSPEGFILNTEILEAAITNTVAGNHAIEVDAGIFINYQGSITFKKLAETEATPLAGAEFGLYEDAEAMSPVIDKNSGQPLTAISAEDGTVMFTNLAPGTYYLQELTAPEGFIRNMLVSTVVIPDQSEAAKDIDTEADAIMNYQGSVSLSKTDLDGKPLKDAVFNLMRDSEVAAGQLATDENGMIIVTGLKPGKYQWIEQQAPKGYRLDQEPVVFEISDTALEKPEMVKVVKENQAEQTGQPEVPKDSGKKPQEKPSKGKTPLTGYTAGAVIFILLAAGSLILIKIVKKKKTK